MEVGLWVCRAMLLFLALVPLLFQCGECSRSLFSIGDDQLASREKLDKDFTDWVRKVSEAHPSSGDHGTSVGPKQELLAPGTTITVGPGQSIQAAVDSIPTKNTNRVVIQLSAGTYTEQVFIPKNKPYVTLQGAGSGSTIIQYGSTQDSSGSTQDSATFGVNSDGFIGSGVTFKNTAPAPPPGAKGAQAVAFRISGDQGALYTCSFIGAQDTLYDSHGRHYFENCYIEGSIDFIFGDGQSLYMGCKLNALSVNPGSLTAQKRSSGSESTGFSFVKCTISGIGPAYLGRAWGPYSRVVFAYTYIDNVIIPAGWNDFGVSSRQQTVYYGQYQCTGPGASQSGRVSWSHELTAAEAAPFLTTSFIDGSSWL